MKRLLTLTLTFTLALILMLSLVSCKDDPAGTEPGKIVMQTPPTTGETVTEENLTAEPQTQEPQTGEPQTQEPQTGEPQTEEPVTLEPSNPDSGVVGNETTSGDNSSTGSGPTGNSSAGSGSTGSSSAGSGSTGTSTNSHTHSYSNATCTAPAKCSCGATNGSALGHKFNAATCTAPKKCKTCGEASGTALGHNYSSATCTAPKKCKICGETSGTALGHNYSSATCTTPKKCKTCGKTDGVALNHNFTELSLTQKKCILCGRIETTPLSTPPNVTDPLTWEKINAIPIANNSMSESELRKIVTDFFRLSLSFSWTPNIDINYVIASKNRPVCLPAGQVYGGHPYVTGAPGNIYKMMSYYDSETGVLDIQTLGCDADFENVMGSQCSFSSTWAWARVCENVRNFRTTAHMTHANGCLIVGEYTYNTSLSQFSSSGSNSTRGIIQANGNQVMLRSYAAMKPGDGLVTSTGSHARMVSSLPNVVLQPNGTIDGAKSTVTYLDQPTNWKVTTQSDGSPMRVQGGIDVVITFNELLNGAYIPFTLPEFCGLDPVEEASVTCSVGGSSTTLQNLQYGMIFSNYPISNLIITVKNPAGTILLSYDPSVYTRNTTYSLDLYSAIHISKLSPYANGQNTITVDCRVSTGELFTVYNGILAVS